MFTENAVPEYMLNEPEPVLLRARYGGNETFLPSQLLKSVQVFSGGDSMVS